VEFIHDVPDQAITARQNWVMDIVVPEISVRILVRRSELIFSGAIFLLASLA
jgi:hypothetical protein